MLCSATLLATAYSGPGVERTADCQARRSVLKSIIDVEGGEVAGHGALQPQQTSAGAHQDLPSLGCVARPETSANSPVLLVGTDGPGAAGKLPGRINNYLGRLGQPLLLGPDDDLLGLLQQLELPLTPHHLGGAWRGQWRLGGRGRLAGRLRRLGGVASLAGTERSVLSVWAPNHEIDDRLRELRHSERFSPGLT